ncbi:P63C domain-containing protein [Polynucleobacter asymbioticus]|jgi:hypothetical protein|uniref:Bacteriophage Mx8 p63 C-terminal domain-containing protein n=1 Tax=Polynucleobacter asymbioticus TaxID=576611 RepID=A0AAC9ISL4_9BURK|nr:P63C domain-containing protein [Polynucleobacter asymbioticus]APC01351.1 hypothetical protein AOC25_06855 [Polynucleobacter asymbioticus]
MAISKKPNPIGKANSGKARAAALTPEKRKEISQKGVEAKKIKASMPKVTHEGVIKVLDISIPCYVLSTGQRVLSQRGISEAFTGSVGGGAIANKSGAQKIPRFLAKKDIKPFINNDLMARINSPIEFIPKAGRSALGYDCSLLPEICEVIMDSAKENSKSDSIECKTAELLIRGFARVGIVALVDEATGYQDARAKDALAQILEKFVAKELQPWVKTFPVEYYKELCRLYGVPFPPPNGNFPQFFCHVTNNAIYSRLAPELLPELKKAASKQERKAKLHQYLTSEIGHPKLREHLASIVTLLKLSKKKDDFLPMVDMIHPKFNENFALDFGAIEG